MLTHAEISALYFVIEDCFEVETDSADPNEPDDEARFLASLARGVIRRWYDAEPEGIYADLIELPGNRDRGSRSRPESCPVVERSVSNPSRSAC